MIFFFSFFFFFRRRRKARLKFHSIVRFQDFASRFRELFLSSRAIKRLLKLNYTRSIPFESLSVFLSSTNENLVARIKFSLPPIGSDKLKRKWSGETWLTQITSNKTMFPNQNSNARLSLRLSTEIDANPSRKREFQISLWYRRF